MTSILSNGAFEAHVIPGLNVEAVSTNPAAVREHRRFQGKLVDEHLKSLAVNQGLQLGEKYDPYDAFFKEDDRVTYVDFKFIGDAKHTQYMGWMLHVHFSNNEYQFARKSDLTFVVYQQVAKTDVIKLIKIFKFSEARDLLQMNERGNDLWWTLDLLQFDPTLRTKLSLS